MGTHVPSEQDTVILDKSSEFNSRFFLSRIIIVQHYSFLTEWSIYYQVSSAFYRFLSSLHGLTWYCWTAPVTQIINLDSWIDVTTLALHKCQIPFQWNMAGNRWHPYHFCALIKISGSDFVYIICQPTFLIHEIQPLMILKVECATKPWYWFLIEMR